MLSEAEMLLDRQLVAELEAALKYTFKNIDLLEQAFIHPSNDFPGKHDYQRLEFLGDEVVGLAVSTLLYMRYPDAGEGQLSKARANLIDENALASHARSLGLGNMIVLGRGEEKQGGREKDSIISDVFESLMAVIYLESGWSELFSVMERLFTPLLVRSHTMEELLLHINRDYKTRLQEIAQNLDLPLPVYTIVEKTGPEHEVVFTIECSTMGYVVRGVGRNKKAAEQDAARRILEEMKIVGERI